MLKKLPELLINGVSIYLIGKELVDNSTAQNNWKDLCAQKEGELAALKDEARQAREEIRALHLQFLEIMAQIREIETDRTNFYRQYLQLVEQIEELGYVVTDDNEVMTEAEIDSSSAQALEDILGDDEED